MRFYRSSPPAFGYYAAPDQDQAYYQAVPQGYGYYGAPPSYGAYYGAVPAYGQYAEPQDGYYAAAPQYYGYGDPAGYGYYAEDPQTVEYYGQAVPVTQYAQYAQPAPGAESEFAGYYADAPDAYPVQGYADPTYMGPEDQGMGGYVRSGPPRYNPGCMLPTNVAGYQEASELSGYTHPATVNAKCQGFTPQPATESSEVFRPLF